MCVMLRVHIDLRFISGMIPIWLVLRILHLLLNQMMRWLSSSVHLVFGSGKNNWYDLVTIITGNLLFFCTFERKCVFHHLYGYWFVVVIFQMVAVIYINVITCPLSTLASPAVGQGGTCPSSTSSFSGYFSAVQTLTLTSMWLPT